MADEPITRTIIGAVAGTAGLVAGSFFRYLGDRGTQQMIVQLQDRITALETDFRAAVAENAALRKENELLKRWIKYLRKANDALKSKVAVLEHKVNEGAKP